MAVTVLDAGPSTGARRAARPCHRARTAAASPPPRTVRVDAEVEEIARLMTDFDLTVIDVVDDQERLQGVVTVDDVLELVLKRGWRRRFTLDDES